MSSSVFGPCRFLPGLLMQIHFCFCCFVVWRMQASIGKLNVTGIAPTAAMQGLLSSPLICAGYATAVIPTLAPSETVVCTGSYTFDQASFESGSRTFAAAFATESQLGAPLVPAVVTVTPQLQPSLSAAIAPTSCVKPMQAGTAVFHCLCLFTDPAQSACICLSSMHTSRTFQ